MQYLKNKYFKRDMKDHGLDDGYLKNVLDDIYDGRAIPLGHVEIEQNIKNKQFEVIQYVKGEQTF